MHRLNTLRLTLILILLLLSLSLVTGSSTAVLALPPQTESADDRAPGIVPGDPSIVGVSSTAIDCLAAGALAPEQVWIATSCPPQGTVELNWQGDVEHARLVLSIPDPTFAPQAPHTIRVNGQAAAWAPVCSLTQPCIAGEYVYLNVSPEAVRQGSNQIEITADARPDNRWVISNVRLQVYGSVTPVRLPASGEIATSDVTAATPFIITFKNALDSTNQQAMAQVPDTYNPSVPAPLVAYAHARSRTMEDGVDYLGAAANAKGWLLVSPQLHGSWPIPPECFDIPNDCDYDDQVLAGTTAGGGPARPGAWAHASRESQYDLVGAVKYMVDHYNVKPDQIYLVGGSMGGQATGVTAARFPHLFAAAYDYMGISSLGQWYGELGSTFDRRTLEKECHINGVLKAPAANPFCYQQRSSVELARNWIHTPISLTHSIYDEMVPISHSRNLRNAINSFSPDIPVTLYEERASLWKCEAPYHCLSPNPSAVLRYLDGYRLNNNPSQIRIAADESKLYYWMNLVQTGGAHWTYVDVTRDTDSPTVQVTTNDPSAVRVGLNLGTGPRLGEVLMQPGMGFPATTYLRKGANYFDLVDYSVGYLNTQVTTTGPSTFTLSALDVAVTADPAVVPDDQTHTSAITVQVRDSSDQANPVPNGTPVQLETTEGTFDNGQKTRTLNTVNGQVATTLTVNPSDNLATITATIRLASGTATVDIVKLALGLKLTPASQVVYANVPFTMNYRVTNEGDATVSAIAVTDDNGIGGQFPVCQNLTLAPGASTTCQRQISLSSSTTVHAQAAGQSPAGDPVTANDGAAITVIAPGIGLSSTPNPLYLYPGQSGTLTYRISNTGDTVLTSVKVQDDNGGAGSSTICSGITLQPGSTATCSRLIDLAQTSTISSTATGSDPLLNPVRAVHSSQVQIISPAIELSVSQDQIGYRDQALPGRCSVRNTGNTTLSNVTVVHDNGTPGQTADDVTLSQGLTLAAGESKPCGDSIVPSQSGTIIVAASGVDPMNGTVVDSGSIHVTLIAPALSMSVSPWQTVVQAGESVSFRYTVTNSGDVPLEDVSVIDDNGTPYNSSDDYSVCRPDDMQAGAERYCGRTMAIGQELTITATATGTDPLDNEVSVQIQATVVIGGRIYLPYIVYRR